MYDSQKSRWESSSHTYTRDSSSGVCSIVLAEPPTLDNAVIAPSNPKTGSRTSSSPLNSSHAQTSFREIGYGHKKTRVVYVSQNFLDHSGKSCFGAMTNLTACSVGNGRDRRVAPFENRTGQDNCRSTGISGLSFRIASQVAFADSDNGLQ